MRHLLACRNATLPGRRMRLLAGGAPVGWVLPDLAAEMAGLGAEAGPHSVRIAGPGSLEEMAAALARAGRLRRRGERFDVRADAAAPGIPAGAVVGQVDRGALPALGIRAEGVHLNGLVRRRDGLHLWVGRRAADKALDPGKLDHVVAGGVPAGLTPEETLVKEAGEEAGIPAALARQARHVATIAYAMERPEGLRRDRLFCYDLTLPEDFTPVPVDGEVSGFELWPLARALEAVRDGDGFKFNVNLVLADLFLRTGLVDSPALRRALDEDSNDP